MPELLIYGASDDLIEVDGAGVSEEYSYDEDPRATIVVVSGQGQLVEVTPLMDDDGNWTATVRIVHVGQQGFAGGFCLVPRPDHDGDDMAVSLHVHHPVNVYKAVAQ